MKAADVSILAGLGMIVTGTGMIYFPAALILAGLLSVLVGAAQYQAKDEGE